MEKKKLNFNNVQFAGESKAPANETTVDKGNSTPQPEKEQAVPTDMGRFVSGTGDKTTVFGVPYGIFKRLKPEHKQYYYDKAMKAEKLAQANEIEARATKESEGAYNRLENRQEASRKENPFLSALSAGAGEMAGFTTPYQAVADPEIAASSAALNNVQEAREVIVTSDRKDKTSTSKELGKGFINQAKKLKTWDFGATDVSDNKALLFAAQKKQRGEQTTPAEDALLESAALTAAVHGDFDKDTSMAYNIGEGAAVTASYMKDFLITGGLQGLGRAAVEKFGVDAAKKTISQIAKNAALRAGGDLVGAAGMAATVHAGQTAADAIDRMTGDVIPTFDKDGNTQFDKTEGGESGGKALAKAFGNTVIEDYSEMFGEYFSPINSFINKTAGKVADKIGLKKVHEAIASIPSSEWGKAYNHFTEQTHWNGFTGEYGEELVGTAMNAAFVGDQKFSDLIDPQQQKETFLSVALMSGVMGGANIAGYRTPKYLAKQNLKTADRNAYNKFGEEWNQLRLQVENADDEGKVSVMNNILSDKDLSPEKKSAFTEYVARLQAYHGTNIADAKRKIEGEVPEEQLQLENSYDQGTNIVDPAERKAAKEELDSIVSNLSDEEVSLLNKYNSAEDYHYDSLGAEDGSPFVTFETAFNYFNAKAKYDGMIDSVRDNIESQVKESDQAISDRTHEDGNIYEIRLKTDDNTPYYIVKGNISVDPDTQRIDTNSSDDKVILVNAEGHREMRPIRDIEKLYNQDSAEQLKATTAQTIRAQESEKAANEIEGVRDFAQDEVVTINTPEGLKEVVVNGITPEGNYEVVSTDNSPIVNGEVATVLDKKQLSQMENEAKKVQNVDQSEGTGEMVQQNNEAVTPSGADTNLEGTTTEQISNAPAETDSNVSEVQSENESIPQAEQNNLSNEEQPIPYDEDGEPIFHQMPVEQSASLLSELDREDSFLIIDNNINALSKEVEKLSKTKPKSTSFTKIKAEREEIKGRLAEAQQKLDYWNNLKDVMTKPVAPVNPSMEISKGGLEARKEETAKAVEENNSKIGTIKQKFDTAPKVEGLQDEIILANGEKMKGRYILTEAEAVTPSHNPVAGYTKSEGFPVDENGRTVNDDRDYENDKQAQLQVEQKAQKYDSRAIQNPVIVSNDGIVLSGNDRTMAGQIAANNGTDQSYKEYARNYSNKYGFTPEQVDGLKNPRILFVPDEQLPYNAETFAKFNADDKKTQNKTEQAVKAGKIINEQTVSKAASILDGFESLPEFYSNPQATKEMLHLLLNDGIIGQNEVAEMMDGESFSSIGKDFIENALIGSVLGESAVRKAMQMKDLRQVIIKSLTQISQNKKFGDFSFKNEITDAINLLYDARKAGVKTGQTIDDYMRQGNLFGENALDLYGATVQMLANALNKGQLFFKRTLSAYNKQAEQASSGQTDLFKGDVRSKDEIINDVLNILGYEQGTRTTDSAKQPERGSSENETGNVTPINEGTRTRDSTREQGTGTEGLNQQEKEAIAEVQALTKSEEHAAIEKEAEKVNTNPSEAQKEAGNYKMGHIKVQGFDITLENPQGSERSGTDTDGKPWSITMNNHYGYFKGTEGKDGDHIDTFLGDNLDSDKVFVVDQVNQDGSFDEHKVMLGFNSMEEAKAAYLSNYEEGWQGLGGITETTVENFRKWTDKDTRKIKPFADYKEVKESSTPVETKDDIELVKTSDGVLPIKKRSISQQPKQVDVGGLFDSLNTKGEAKLSDHTVEEQLPEEKPTGKSKWVDEEDAEEFASLRAQLRETVGSQLNAGVDPKIILLGGRMSYLIMKHGVRQFGEYAKAMIEEVGDAIRPHLQGLYEFARLSPEVKESTWANELTPHDEVIKFDIDNFDKIDTTPEIQKTEPKAEKAEEKEPESQKKNVSSEQEKLKTEKNGKEQKRGSERESTPVGEGTQQEVGGLDGERIGSSNREHNVLDKGRSERIHNVHKSTEKLNQRNNHNERGVDYAPKSTGARFKANIAAIKLMKKLVDKKAIPTEDEMKTLRKYSGWGGMGLYFNKTSDENATLREALDAEEYDAAVMSINSAYYTPASVIDTLWDAAEKLGFKGGNVLEGSAGIGSIIGSMPQSMSEKSSIEAVEIDKVSGNILKLLYPDAKVNVQGFEDTNVPNNSVDLAITNVPFVTGLKVFDKVDKDLSKAFANIHDFCIAKNIRKLKEGGIGIFITSNGTLDKSKKLREWITSKGNADVVGAFRMNNKTFEGTNATSDIIIIRKRVNGKQFPGAIDVLNTSVVRTAAYNIGKEWSNKKGDYVDVNKDVAIEHNTYFQQHPENMAGKMQFGFENNDTFRPESVGLYPAKGMNQEQMLKDWVESLSPAFGAVKQTETKEAESTAKREGTLFIDNSGDIVVSQYGKAVSLGVNKNKVKGKEKSECLNDYIAIKEALQAVLDNQSNNEDDKGLKPLLKKLNNAYDTFVSNYGPLNNNTSIAFLKNDVDFPAISAIEDYEEVKNQDGTVEKNIEKTAVFNQRVVGFKTEPEPKNLPDAIIASVYKFGNIDVSYIAEKLGKSENDVKREIVSGKKGFVNPSTGLVEVRHEYLSGNVREKLELAKAANTNGEYNSNIEELEKVIPMDIPAHLIDFSLGSSWLDKEVYKGFMQEKTGVKCNIESVEGAWMINPEGNTNNEKNRHTGVYSEVFKEVIPGHTLISAALNNKSVAVKRIIRHSDKTTETIYDNDATQACATRIAELKDEFKEWMKSKISENEDLAEKVMRTYNDKFNCIVPKSIDEEFLPERFEGASVDITLYAHQKKSVVRGTTEPLMLAHEVGTGKTFTLISTAMEMRRLGTAKKPMVVVQNSTVGQFVSSAKKLYPNAKILTLTEKDRTPEGRKAFYAKIKYNDWDIIVVPQSTFEKIPDSPEWQNYFINEKIEDKMHALEAMKEMEGVDSRVIDALESELEALQDELIQVSTGTKKDAKSGEKAAQNAAVRAKEQLDRNTDDVEFFDQMDIDAILVDEAHEYKRLGFATTMTRGVKGIDPAGSKKAAGVYIKTRAILEKNGWKNVVFATGTPISNTAAEIWTFMKYLMPKDVMKANDIYYFDDFVRNFGSIMQSLEFATNGKFKENTRFASYINKPELIRLWASVTDTVLTKDVDYVNDKVPDIEVGKAQDIYLPQSDSLIDIMNAVRKQLQAFEEMSGKEKKANSHIPLTMYGIAKRAAIDPRLVDKNAKDEPDSKTNKAVDEVVKSLEETKDYKGTVAVFCDNQRRWDYVDGKKVAGFDLFEEMKRKLVDKGVDESQIVIMKSGMSAAKKEKLFADVNAGNVRVVIGNTQTLGTGVNIQERLHTLIHMDAPDRPMDYTQRNGRILRQGNMHKQWNKPVRILRFGVEDSLDVTSYQRLKTKAGFIDSIMDGKSALANNQENRTLEEEEEGLFDNPVAVLSGSEYALKKNQAEREYRKYSNKKTQYEADQIYITNKSRRNAGQIKANEGLISDAKESLKNIENTFPEGKVKTVKIEGKKCSNETEIESALKELVNKKINEKVEAARNNGRYNGETVSFKISLDGIEMNTNVKITRDTSYDDKFKAFRVIMHKDVTYSIDKLGLENVPVSGGYVKGALTDILDNVITGKDSKEAIEVYERANARMQEENEIMSKRSGKPFEFDNELNQAKEKVSEYTTLMKQELDEKNKKYEGRGNSEAVELSTETEEEEDDDTRYRTSMYGSSEVTIDQEEAMDEINSISESLNTPVRIITNVDEITDSNGKRELSKRNSKGWFDAKTGEVVVVLPNADSIEDAIRTVLHEVVAHKGLRNMFGKEFDSFLEKVYDSATPEIRKKINSLAAKNGWNINIATEEYLASLSEKGFEDKQEQTLWGKIKQAFMDMIHKAKINLGYNISDEDLRYILWKSYQKLNNDSPILKNAADVAMKDKLFRSSKAPKQAISNVKSETNSDVLFRSKEEPVTPENLIQTYDEKFKKKFLGVNVHKFKEAYQDSMLALKDLQELISKSTGKEIKDHENAYIAENQLSSKGAAESEFYKDNYFKPMIKAINALTKKGKTYKDVIDYMVAKHGLERNEVMARRDADKWAEDAIETANKMALNGEIDSDQLHEMMDAISTQIEDKYNEFRQKDYSGLTQLTGSEEGYEDIAQTMVDEFEKGNTILVYKLWKDVNAATKQTLLKSYTSGLMSKSTYEKVRDMFENYIPLRGWDDTIASDVYDYILSERSTFNAPVKSAQGRSSLADDPIAVIANMADSAILQGNRNLMKQKFLNMVLNHPNDLVTVKDMWYENKGTEEKPDWVGVFPEIPVDATTEELEEAVSIFEERMAELESKGMASKGTVRDMWYENKGTKESPKWISVLPEIGPGLTSEERKEAVSEFKKQMAKLESKGMAKKTKNGLNVVYRTNAKERNEHIVTVKRGGKEHVIYINGNPRAAQAVNGLTNPDSTDHRFMKTIQWINRQMAANFTTRNPAFVLTNMSRDLIFSTTAIDIKENGKYSRKFKKNVAKNLSQIAVLMAKLHKGTLDVNKETERLFSEFIQNGGETGYTALKSVDDYKKIVANELLKAKGKTDLGSIIGLEVGKITTPTTLGIVPAFRALAKWTEFGNRCAEDISRFSTYMTSRQMGRSVQQSINDAKEVTVNFNKKGAGGYMGATTIKSLFLFFNAAVQSLNNLCKLAKRSPIKFSGAIGSFTAAGLLIPLMNNILMAAIGGDDDKDAYNNLPEWVRRNNLCLFVGNKKFITIPLPIELRAFYGIGEMAYQYSAGNMEHRNMGLEMLSQISGLIPLDPTGGSNSLIPDAVKPIAQVLENKDFYDKPIYKKFDYNELMPEYTKAYAGTSNWLIRSTEFLNNHTDGNRYKPGWANLNPAIIEHTFEGYFGGMAKTVNQTAKTIGMIWNDDERLVRNVPVVNRFVSSSSDERNAYSRINEEYYNYKKEYELTKQQVNGFNKEEKKGVFDYAQEVDFIHNSKEYQRYEIFKDHEKTIKSLQDDIKIASGEEKKQLEKMLNIEKTQLVEQMAETE